MPGNQVPTMSIATQNKELLTQFLEEVWNAGNVDLSDQYVAPRYTIHHDPGDPWERQELDLAGFKERVRLSRALFPDQSVAIQDVLAEADRVMITWLWSATHRADILGFPATGNTVRMSGAIVYFVNGGRLAGHWQITDRLGVYGQLRQGLASA